MGLDYSLCVILPRARAEDLLRQLSKRLDTHGKRRIAQLEFQDNSHLFAGLSLEGSELENNICFSLQVKLETEMSEHLADHRLNCVGREGAFGCLWTSIFEGSEHMLFKMTAATSGMSRVLRDSQAIHKLWVGFCKDAKAIAGYVDLETQSGLMLYPYSSDFVFPFEGNQQGMMDAQTFDLNAMIESILHANKLKP
jgi:hypothetical protein